VSLVLWHRFSANGKGLNGLYSTRREQGGGGSRGLWGRHTASSVDEEDKGANFQASLSLGNFRGPAMRRGKGEDQNIRTWRPDRLSRMSEGVSSSNPHVGKKKLGSAALKGGRGVRGWQSLYITRWRQLESNDPHSKKIILCPWVHGRGRGGGVRAREGRRGNKSLGEFGVKFQFGPGGWNDC